MRRLVNAIRLVIRVQLRSFFPQIYLGGALAAIAGIRGTGLEDRAALLVPAFLLVEPGALSFYLTAAHRYLDKSQKSTIVLLVTPMRSTEHVASLILVPAAISTAAGAIVHGAILGPGPDLVAVILSLLLLSILAGLLGLTLSLYFDDFTRFLAATLPLLLLLATPLVSLLEILPGSYFIWMPSGAALSLFARAAEGNATWTGSLLPFAVLMSFCGAGAWAVPRIWDRRKWALVS